jgi:hypothetical protein
MVRALLAREGFPRVAAIASELTGAQVELLVPRPGSWGAEGSASERFVAELVGGGLPAWPAGVTEVVPIVVDGRTAGAVLASGELEQGTAKHLDSAARAALTGIAMLEAREEVRREEAAGLIGDLLVGRRLEPGVIAARARRLGCDLDRGFVALAAGSEGGGGHAEIEAAIAEIHPDALVERIEGTTYALVPGAAVDAAGLAARLGAGVARAHSSAYADPGEAPRALDEVRTLLSLAHMSGEPDTDGPAWDSLRILHGAYVHDPARLRGFCERTVAPMIRHDGDGRGQLQATFWTYQRANCNMNLAAERLETHRHTVANRLRRIRQLTGLDPQRGLDRELLALGLRTHLVIANSGA